MLAFLLACAGPAADDGSPVPSLSDPPDETAYDDTAYDDTAHDTARDTARDTGDTAELDTADTGAVLPPAEAPLGERSLADAADARLYGHLASLYAGHFVASAGDTDADGYADLLVGSGPGDVSYVVRGPVGGDHLLSGADATITASGADDGGMRVATPLGDVDGDGCDDLALGAYDAAGGRGRAYVLHGPLAGAIDASAATLLTGDTDDRAGIAAAGGGDLTGDGLGDLLVGAYGHRSEAGGVYVVAGPPTPGDLHDHALLAGEAGSLAGGGVASLGDVDGDGVDDLLVGAQAGGDAARGRVYLVRGPVTDDADLADADASWDGEQPGDQLGRSVAGPGDVDGDGLADLLAGTLGNNEGGTGAGSAYLVHGGAHAGAGSIGVADVRFRGEASGDRVGYPVAGAGDLDADGFADLALSAEGSDRAAADAGAVYVVYGPAAAGTFDLAGADAILLGERGGDYASAAAAVGDTDADGFPDLLVGGSWHSSLHPNGGVAWLVRGGPR